MLFAYLRSFVYTIIFSRTTSFISLRMSSHVVDRHSRLFVTSWFLHHVVIERVVESLYTGLRTLHDDDDDGDYDDENYTHMARRLRRQRCWRERTKATKKQNRTEMIEWTLRNGNCDGMIACDVHTLIERRHTWFETFSNIRYYAQHPWLQ